MSSKHGNDEKNSSFGKISVIIIVLIIIAVGITFFVKRPKENKIVDDRLISTWTTDGITVYEFYNKGEGKMKLPSSEYKFTYVVDDNKLYIDWRNTNVWFCWIC